MYSKLSVLCICFLFCHFSYALETKQDPEHELQILIDVSGSMKHTDPDNLRISAVKLLINLLPVGSKAGIWLFAEKTTALVETGIVNQQWKNKALARIKKIHSRGLFTNIEDAIQTSAQAWFNSSPQQKRNLILLTDGMVDISKDIMQSAESRERVMVEQVPLLLQAGAKVHTIALSDNADSELMDKLAFDTNGWAEAAQSAAQLQKVFFSMFKKSIPQDTVPLKGNMFTVDESIKEFSVLVFKTAGASATQLVTPAKAKIGRADKIDNVAWLEEANYDLVTIKKPMAGEWTLVADMDPDNQVMVVTDLKFQLDEIPNHLSGQESFDVSAYFTDQQQLISREDFLSLIDISIELSDEQGGKNEWKMQPVSGKKGLFNQTIGPLLGNGKHTLKVLADGKTFQRERIQTIALVDSPIVITMDVDQDERMVTLKLKPDQTVLITEMMTVQAMITQAGKDPETRIIDNNKGKWQFRVEVPEEGDSKVINFSIMAKTVQGQSVSPNVKPVVIDDRVFFKTVSSPVVKTNEVEKEVEIVLDQAEELNEHVADEKEPVNWIKTSAIVIAINSVLIVAVFFLFRFIKKKVADKQARLLDRLQS